MALFAGCKTSNEPKAPVALTWEMGASDIEPGYYENTFILKNISQKPLKKNWTIYYSQLPRGVKQEGASEVKVEVVNGNFFKMYPTDEFASLAPGDSMRITFLCTYKLDRNSHVPEGTYWVETVDGKEGSPLPVALKALPLPSPESMSGYPDATKIYESNLRLAGAPALVQSDILPSVKKVLAIEGDNVVLEGKVALAFPENFAGEAKLLKEKLTGLYGLEVVGNASVKIVLEELLDRKEAVNDEYYTINIGDNLIKISAATPHGIFNGTQTLLSMLKGKQTPYLLEAVSIRDYPDLAYRGQMIDIARNFTAPENLKKLVDIFASYKLNVLHFHFCDDEAWRLEIPGLEELTAVGSRRGHTTDESQCLYPCYDGGYDPDAKTVGNGYYSREEFIDLLKYAAERHVRIVPEIESPGHARAAIVSMKARYNKANVNVENIATSLEGYQAQLLKDVAMFDRLYDQNTAYFRQLTLYIIAGEEKLQRVREGELKELMAKAAESGDAMDAQKANDLAAQCDRFEKKLHDLKLTRQVSMQMAPQIRLLQNNDSLLVERIQSTISNTLPLWKNQMVLALGLHHTQQAMQAQRAVTNMTNELLKKNAETLKMSTIETAKESERGIIDIETLVQTNQSLIDTISEVMTIQQEGHTKRVEAEKTLYQMENDLKKKLLETKI